MADEIVPEQGQEAVKVDESFLRISAEVRKLEKRAIQMKAKELLSGAIFEPFDAEKISINHYESALESARGIESSGVTTKKTEKEQKPAAMEGRFLSDEEMKLIPKEKVEVVERTEKEIAEEEKKLMDMKDKFAKLISDIPKEKQEVPKEMKVLEEAAKKAEEKPTVEESKPEEIKELSENFKRIMLKKEEREKRERIRKMKKDIEEMLESGE
ncbi:MAG: hypothetical protein Sv326_0665 [Candidatus Fermentimicrarchaeum limneticum]|uniref:Uncharacterized protein n=1 Tax=Fermentimicrarchaeum limneticum TaxID=2795018 RepID=A0A7D6BFL3_FERL1|nr:MAG: hypothetical protein Sv326_0665 [Candidatus Fermentimicrarchaeum limneticum]